jgi:hypothetical protein
VAISTRTFLTIAVTALLASGMTYLATRPTRAAAAPATTYHVRVGDYVAIPALDWTCALTRSAAGALFSCSTNDKPISDVAVEPHKIAVHAVSKPRGCPSAAPRCTIGTPTAPTKTTKARYVFPFSHD